MEVSSFVAMKSDKLDGGSRAGEKQHCFLAPSSNNCCLTLMTSFSQNSIYKSLIYNHFKVKMIAFFKGEKRKKGWDINALC